MHAHRAYTSLGCGSWEVAFSSFMPNWEVLYLQHKPTISRLKQEIYQMLTEKLPFRLLAAILPRRASPRRSKQGQAISAVPTPDPEMLCMPAALSNRDLFPEMMKNLSLSNCPNIYFPFFFLYSEMCFRLVICNMPKSLFSSSWIREGVLC